MGQTLEWKKEAFKKLLLKQLRALSAFMCREILKNIGCFLSRALSLYSLIYKYTLCCCVQCLIKDIVVGISRNENENQFSLFHLKSAKLFFCFFRLSKSVEMKNYLTHHPPVAASLEITNFSFHFISECSFHEKIRYDCWQFLFSHIATNWNNFLMSLIIFF
jgi:hypothetical protein